MPTGLPTQPAKDEIALTRLGRRVAAFGILAGIVLQALPLPAQAAAVTVGGSAGLLLVTDEGLRAALRGAGRLLYFFGAAFLAASVVSILGSDSVPRAVRVSISLLLQLLLFHAIATRFRRQDVDRLVWALIGFGAALSCVLLLTALEHPGLSPTRWMETAGLPFFSVPNDLLITLVLAPFPLLVFLESQFTTAKLMAGISLVASFAAMIVYRSRTGVALFVILCFGLVLTRARISWRSAFWLLTGGVGLFLLVDAATGFALLQKFAQLDSLSTRIPLWAAAWKMFLTAPWFGHGPGTFSILYEGYQNSIHFPDWVLVLPTVHSPWAHSLYLEVLAERGLIGLLCFVGVIFAAGRMLKSVGTLSKDGLWMGLTLSLALIMFGGLSEFSLLRYWFSQVLLVILGMAVALNTSGGERDAERT
jgi:hypothetical protein